MGRFSYFAFSLCFLSLALSASGSNVNLDSLAASINTAETEMIRMKRIERSLDIIANQYPSGYNDLRSKIEYNKINTHQMLLLDAYDSRKLMYSGEFQTLLDQPSEANPFTQFYRGSAYFYLGDTENSMKSYRSANVLFKFYNDTIYLASTYNNIGALHWHLDNLDSALIYFQKAKEYTHWYNDMLENNILAISNTLDDKSLSLYQIRYIKQNTDNENNPYFLNNAVQYYKKHDEENLDSILNHLRGLYAYLSEVPIQVLPEFIRQGWMLDSIVDVMLKQPSNSFYDDALNELLMNEIVGDSAFTSEVLHQLAVKSNSSSDSTLAEIYRSLNGTERAELARTIFNIDSDRRTESLKKLAYAARDFQVKIEQKESQFRNYALIGLGALTVGLILIIVSQYRRILQVKESARLSMANAELAAKNASMQEEISKVRSGIEDLAETSMKRLKGLRTAVEELGSNQKHAIGLLDDLNVITTHEEGMLRFKIKKIVDGTTCESIESLKEKMGDREILILKLTIMNFRSKEIASLMGVSPQHVNNMRSKMKTVIEETTSLDYDDFMQKVENELFNA